MRHIHLELTDKMGEQLEQYSASQDMSKAAFLRSLIATFGQFLADKDKKKTAKKGKNDRENKM